MCVSGFRLADLAARFALYPSLCRSEPVPEPGQRIPEDQKTKANHLRNLYPRWRSKAVIGDADQAKDKAQNHEKNPEPIALPSRPRLLISLLRHPYCPHSRFILRVLVRNSAIHSQQVAECRYGLALRFRVDITTEVSELLRTFKETPFSLLSLLIGC
jgi:hypothetical protein